MKRFLIILSLIFAAPIFAMAQGRGIIYSINAYGHIGGKTEDSVFCGGGGDLGVTFHLMPQQQFTPIIYASMGINVIDQALQGDIKLLGGVSWHITDFFYAGVSLGGQGFIQTDTGLGGSVVVDTSVLLHLVEVIGIRAGCSASLGSNGFIISPHVGIASCIDFSWLIGEL